MLPPFPKPRVTWPTRVSRLYPAFSLVLVLSCAVLTYAWQSAQIELVNLGTVEQRDKDLHAQVDALTANNKLDAAKLQDQNTKISDAQNKLKDVQSQLDAATHNLATKQDQLAQAQTQVKSQQDQLTQNSDQIAKLSARPPLFSFQNQSSLTTAEVTQKEADVKDLISHAYDAIGEIYGKPYLLGSITITFVDSFTIVGSSGEIVIQNGPNGIDINIHLKDFHKDRFQDVNTVIHEIVHGYHGAAVFETSALEEGMTVAATDAVMAKMEADGTIQKFPTLYLNLTAAQYAQYNQTLRIPKDNQLFYSDPEVATVYQAIGTAWQLLYKQDPDFFKKLNAAYYPKVQRGLKPDTAMVLDAIRSVEPVVGSQGIDAFLSSNRAFNPS
jgi:myosin heavy subunit